MPEDAYVLSGDVPDDVAAAVIAYATRHGYRVYRAGQEVDTSKMEPVGLWRDTTATPRPRWSARALESLRLTDALLTEEFGLRSLERRNEVAKILKGKGINTAGDLTRIDFDAFMNPHMGFMAANWRARSFVLEFMINNGISFSDMSPALVFQTHVTDVDALSVRTTNHLLRYGIRWVELLTYVYGYELLDIRNFGKGCLDEVKRVLAARGLALRPQTD